MTKPMARPPQRRTARSNRARILDTARQELGRNPNVTMEELAQAAGVVRRTLFGHLPGREALLEALADEASAALREATGSAAGGGGRAGRAGLGAAVSGDVARGRQVPDALGTEVLNGSRRSWLRVRDAATDILERGQREGVFHSHLPPVALSSGLEALTVALLDSVNDGLLDDEAVPVVIAALIAAGMPENQASDVVLDVSAASSAEPAPDDGV
ncbi:TetR/AcrR family transcriptional regulator [Streptomyces sp. NPDC005236]|uniref:TetR/AcrR family transcriptional regulator n=1 Tax=Streptomyces sp. NPDC005236 TaxID=3157028 RepID=UPI0033B819D3